MTQAEFLVICSRLKELAITGDSRISISRVEIILTECAKIGFLPEALNVITASVRTTITVSLVKQWLQLNPSVPHQYL